MLALSCNNNIRIQEYNKYGFDGYIEKPSTWICCTDTAEAYSQTNGQSYLIDFTQVISYIYVLEKRSRDSQQQAVIPDKQVINNSDDGELRMWGWINST